MQKWKVLDSLDSSCRELSIGARISFIGAVGVEIHVIVFCDGFYAEC